jgi:hypothetical protein
VHGEYQIFLPRWRGRAHGLTLSANAHQYATVEVQVQLALMVFNCAARGTRHGQRRVTGVVQIAARAFSNPGAIARDAATG